MLRRELLAGVLGVAGATLLGLPRTDAQVLTGQPVTIDGLRRLVDRAQADYLACRYSRLAKGLPQVIQYAQATAGDRSTALDLHAEAVIAARPTRGALPAALTPSAVDARFLGLYEISVHRKLGDYGTAIDAARAIRPEQITVTERKVRYWEDVALAFGSWGKREQAFHALLAAERAAPQEVRLRPWAHRLTRQLRSSGPTLPGLREFAIRAGVA